MKNYQQAPVWGVSENVVFPQKMYGRSGGEIIFFQPSHGHGFPQCQHLRTHLQVDRELAGSLGPQDVADCRACWRRRRWKGR